MDQGFFVRGKDNIFLSLSLIWWLLKLAVREHHVPGFESIYIRNSHVTAHTDANNKAGYAASCSFHALRVQFFFRSFSEGGIPLCGCGTWSLTLKGQSTLAAFENNMLGKLTGAKKEKRKTGENYKNYFQTLYSPSVILQIK